jgi:hypothetical protein
MRLWVRMRPHQRRQLGHHHRRDTSVRDPTSGTDPSGIAEGCARIRVAAHLRGMSITTVPLPSPCTTGTIDLQVSVAIYRYIVLPSTGSQQH